MNVKWFKAAEQATCGAAAAHEDEYAALQALLREQRAFVPFVYVFGSEGHLIEYKTTPDDALARGECGARYACDVSPSAQPGET